jgi:orotidine-5'-phosphate decarboxylase
MSCDLILALDVPTREAAAPILRQLRGQLRWVKIGLQMFTAYGPNYVREVAGMGFNIFLDLKLHDIPNTVAKAVESLGPLPIQMLTLHTAGGGEMMQRRQGRPAEDAIPTCSCSVSPCSPRPTTPASVKSESTPRSPDQVARLGQLAADSGLRGLVCSPLEVAMLRQQLPAGIQLITPGIRPASEAGSDDQKRIMTPADAARAGSTYIVVGRPILQAADPAAAARAILAELSSP